jgi:hypothetical protein
VTIRIQVGGKTYRWRGWPWRRQESRKVIDLDAYRAKKEAVRLSGRPQHGFDDGGDAA